MTTNLTQLDPTDYGTVECLPTSEPNEPTTVQTHGYESGTSIDPWFTHFQCVECEQVFPLPLHSGGYGAVGYAVRASDNATICYACARTVDLREAATTGRLFAYVSGMAYKRTNRIVRRHWTFAVDDTDATLTTWPGLPLNVGRVRAVSAWQSNFGDVRIALSATLPTGPMGTLEVWHGTYFASSGDYCRLTRNKRQAQ